MKKFEEFTYKDNTPNYNTNGNVFNFKNFNKKSEEEELKAIKRSFKKNELEIGQSERKYKFNKVTRKMDDMSKSEVEGKLDDSQEG